MQHIARTSARSPWPRSFVVVAAAAFALAACGEKEQTSSMPTESTSSSSTASSAPAASGSLDGTTYLSTGATGFELVPGSVVTIEFASSNIRVSAGCNGMVGRYRLDGTTLVVPGLASTKMACADELMQQDDTVAALVQAKPTVAVQGDTLTITDGTRSLTLLDSKVADPDRPLGGTTWTLVSISSPTAVTSYAVPASITFDLQADGTGTANVQPGCNTGSARVTVQDDTIEMGPLGLTRMMCDDDAMDVERAVIAVLTGTVTFSIEGRQLTLTNGDSALLLTAAT